MNKISILIADDHPLFRQGVAYIFSLEADFLVVGQAGTGYEALQFIRSQSPQVAIVDVNLPGMSGPQVARQARAEKMSTRIILISAEEDHELRSHFNNLGVTAYITKEVQPEKLVKLVRDVAQSGMKGNGQGHEKSTTQWLRNNINYSFSEYTIVKDGRLPLSTREMEVLSYISSGLSNKEIAVVLGISHQTVKNHVTAILRKLGVEDRTQAAIYALRRGWVELHSQYQNT